MSDVLTRWLFKAKDVNVEKTQKRIQKSTKDMTKGTDLFGKVGAKAFASVATKVGAAAAGVFAFSKLTAEALDATRLAANVDQARAAFDSIAQAAGESAEAILTSLEVASAGTISELDTLLSASRANLLGLPIGELDKLLEIARASAIATGQEVGQLFDDIVTGIGRASPLILDNLGITVKIGDANQKYAEQVGKTVAQLSKQEQTQALLNSVLDSGAGIIAKVGSQLTELSAAQTFQRMNASAQDLKATIGEALLPGAKNFASAFADGLDVIEKALSRINREREAAAALLEIAEGRKVEAQDLAKAETSVEQAVRNLADILPKMRDVEADILRTVGNQRAGYEIQLRLLQAQKTEWEAILDNAEGVSLQAEVQTVIENETAAALARIAARRREGLELAEKISREQRNQVEKLEEQRKSLRAQRDELIAARDALTQTVSQHAENAEIVVRIDEAWLRIARTIENLTEKIKETGRAGVDFAEAMEVAAAAGESLAALGLGQSLAFGGGAGVPGIVGAVPGTGPVVPGAPSETAVRLRQQMEEETAARRLSLRQLRVEIQTNALGAIREQAFSMLTPLEQQKQLIMEQIQVQEAAIRTMETERDNRARLGEDVSEFAAAIVIARENIEALQESQEGASAAGDVLSGTFTSFTDPLTAMATAFANTVLQIENLQAVLNPFQTVFESLTAIIAGPLNKALAPVVALLKILGETVGKILLPFIENFAGIMKALAPVMLFVANVFIFIGNFLSAVFTGVAVVIQTVLNGIITAVEIAIAILTLGIVRLDLGRVNLTSGFQSQPFLTEEQFEERTEAEETPGGPNVFGGDVTVQRVPDIFVHLHFEAPVIGAGGAVEVGEFMVDAITEFAGVGGDVSFFEDLSGEGSTSEVTQ